MNPKEIRKQLRNVVKELLPEILNQEIAEAVEKKLNGKLEAKLRNIGEHVNTTLEQIDRRAKDVHNLMVRQAVTLSPAPVPPTSSESSQS